MLSLRLVNGRGGGDGRGGRVPQVVGIIRFFFLGDGC